MAKVFVSDTHLTNIANAVREKNGKTTKYKPSEISNAIKAIEVTEDLSSELTTQNNLLTSQTSKLSSVVTALQGKATGGGGFSHTGGDHFFMGNEGDGAVATFLLVGKNFDPSKKYNIKFAYNSTVVQFEGSAMEEIYISKAELNFTRTEENEDEYIATFPSGAVSPTIDGQASITSGDVWVNTAMGICSINLYVDSTVDLNSFGIYCAVWLEEA